MSSTVSDREMRGSDFNVGISKQTAKGAIDANPVFTPVRRTEGKGFKKLNYTEDPTVNNGLQGLEQVKETEDLGAEISAVFSKQSVDLLTQVLHSDPVVVTVTDTDISATATGFNSAGGDFAGFQVGDGFWVSGFTGDDTINGFYIVSAVDANDITTTIAPPATEAAGDSVTVETRRFWNADLPTYNAIQTRATDLSAVGNVNHHTIYDAILNTMSAEIGETGIVTNSASFVAEKEVEGSAAISGQTYASPLTDRAVTAEKSGESAIKAFYVNGLSYTCKMKSLSLEVNNNYEKDDSAACSSLYVRGQPTFSGSCVVRSKISNPFIWRNYSWDGTRVEITVLMRHGGGDETAIVLRQAVINEAEMPDGNGAVANTEASFVCEGDSSANVTIAVYTNWS